MNYKAIGFDYGGTNELVFIDDTAKSLESAGEIGYQPIEYTGFEDLLEKLNRIGVLYE